MGFADCIRFQGLNVGLDARDEQCGEVTDTERVICAAGRACGRGRLDDDDHGTLPTLA